MHSVVYNNVTSDWHEALPLGNGVFGAMSYSDGDKLIIAMNHYEVYYKKLHTYSNKFRSQEAAAGHDPSAFSKIKQMADQHYRDPSKEPIYMYSEKFYRNYGKDQGGESHYQTGELWIEVSNKLKKPDQYQLILNVEAARVSFCSKRKGKEINVDTIVSQGSDHLISKINQSERGLVKSINMHLPARRLQEFKVDFHCLDECTFYYTCSFYPDGEDREKFKPFSFMVMTRLLGAKGKASIYPDTMKIELYDDLKDICLITTVVTEEETSEILKTASARIVNAVSGLNRIFEKHEDYWNRFWKKSEVRIPDKMLENLWYINLYTLACCSGKGGRMYQQACGLNGLWDIKQPTRWGSLWYWDVNIQAAFWPLYTANHLELSEAFNDALLSYTGKAEKMAEEFHGLSGYSCDYPHPLYLCIWPWCAQFLWRYYRYSMDGSFLREKAYPFFRNTLKFVEGYIKFDNKKDRYYFYPEISPEQGPYTRNSTITLASVRFLLSIAVKANKILNEDKMESDKWQAILDKLPDYPQVESGCYGKIIKDSEFAPAKLHLRHPSLLMPVYPTGEINRYSKPAITKIAENTLRYAEENTEIGTFQFGWLSCVSSGLGKGNTAIRLLYEKGIDMSLRPNGLFAEETERWIQFCNINNPAIYHPPMMEASGELVASVNEMLLQSYNGIIDVFPAIPSGKPERERFIGMYDHEIPERIKDYDIWENCCFRGLLAEGAFEVSAERINGKTRWVRLKSLAGGEAAIRNPFRSRTPQIYFIESRQSKKSDFTVEKGILRFSTQKGCEYLLYESKKWYMETAPCSDSNSDTYCAVPVCHEAHTHRRVFLGKDRDTRYFNMLDSFTFDYYEGNCRRSQVSVYRLDFGVGSMELKKDYALTLPRQFHMDHQLGQNFMRITGNTVFNKFEGIGWDNSKDLFSMDRGVPDELRRDFVQGKENGTLMLELPKGSYDLLIVSGDTHAPSYTKIVIDEKSVWKPAAALKPGEFAVEALPLIQKEDGYLKITFSSKEEYYWKINAIIINKHFGLL